MGFDKAGGRMRRFDWWGGIDLQSLAESAAAWTARLQELWPGEVEERLQQLRRWPPTPASNRHFARWSGVAAQKVHAIRAAHSIVARCHGARAGASRALRLTVAC